MNNRIELDWSSRINRVLVEYFNLDQLPLERREDLLPKLISLIDQGLAIRICDELSDKDANEFEAILDTAEGVHSSSYRQFIRSKFPNFLAMVIEEIVLIETFLKYPLIDRAYTDDTPTQTALSDATDLTSDLGSAMAGHGVLFDTAALAIGLAFDPAHHRRTPLAKKQWRVKRIVSWTGKLSGQLWFDVICLTLLMHFQKTGKIKAVPVWAFAWVPVWFAQRRLGIQLLLSLIIPAGATLLITLILISFRLRMKKQLLKGGESK